MGIIPADQVSLCLKIFGSAGNGRFIRMENLRQLRLRAAGLMTQCMDQIDLRRSNARFPQGQQNQLLRFPGNLRDFSSCDIHNFLPKVFFQFSVKYK